jgi:hypothetical protein
MYASASTWAFNVVRQIFEVVEPERLHAVFVSGKEKNVNWNASAKVTVVKSHEISGEARVLDVTRRSSRLLLSVRDPRDCIASLMQAHAYEFPRALSLVEESAALCKSYAKDRRAKLLAYETGFFEKVETVSDIAVHLGYQLSEGVAQTIYDSLRRTEVERYIGNLPRVAGILKDPVSGDLLDPRTQWHTHHAGRTGEIGKWRKVLKDNEAAEIMQRLSQYSELFHGP